MTSTNNIGWRMCACNRARPGHADAPPDPTGGTGCGMTWRPHGEEIEERHITDTTDTDDTTDIEVQPGGHLRQDVPAGLALPNHPMSSSHMSSEENAMVRPNPTPGTEVPRPGQGGDRR